MIRSLLSMVACTALAATAACGGAKHQAAQPTQTTAGTVETVPATLSPSDIIGVVQELTNADLDHARLGVKQASDRRVKAFAQRVVNDETARRNRQHQLMKDLGVTKPTENPTSSRIKSVENARLGQLKSASMATFDRDFLDGEIEYGRLALDTYDKDLIPSAKDTHIKSRLMEWRGQVERRLNEAQDLRKSLGAK